MAILCDGFGWIVLFAMRPSSRCLAISLSLVLCFSNRPTLNLEPTPQVASSIHDSVPFLSGTMSAQQDQKPHDDNAGASGAHQKTCTAAHSQNQVSASIFALLRKERELAIL
mmetsp:Transcript_37397/g.55725  ORF Transcript_37397/g.55725 Transcript_37397/m.55725 type:complete len:112 (-) Transcript_37397:35-370(-)